MAYSGLYISLECILGFQVLKFLWIYWVRRPVSFHGRHVEHHTEMSAGL